MCIILCNMKRSGIGTDFPLSTSVFPLCITPQILIMFIYMLFLPEEQRGEVWGTYRKVNAV
jgi:hypothetical protein